MISEPEQEPSRGPGRQCWGLQARRVGACSCRAPTEWAGCGRLEADYRCHDSDANLEGCLRARPTCISQGKKDGEGGREQDGVGRKCPGAFFSLILFPSRSNHVSWRCITPFPSFSPSRLAFGFLVRLHPQCCRRHIRPALRGLLHRKNRQALEFEHHLAEEYLKILLCT